MKFRPIIFSAPMVRAILAGQKTQTRRIVKLKDHGLPLALGFWCDHEGKCVDKDGPRYSFGHRVPGDPGNMYVHERVCCPYGRPGDRLWVREAWGVLLPYEPDTGAPPVIGCRADAPNAVPYDRRWRPSIHIKTCRCCCVGYRSRAARIRTPYNTSHLSSTGRATLL